jgi:hypothetical protein
MTVVRLLDYLKKTYVPDLKVSDDSGDRLTTHQSMQLAPRIGACMAAVSQRRQALRLSQPHHRR